MSANTLNWQVRSGGTTNDDVDEAVQIVAPALREVPEMRASRATVPASTARSHDRELVVAAVLMGLLVVLTAWAAPLIAV